MEPERGGHEPQYLLEEGGGRRRACETGPERRAAGSLGHKGREHWKKRDLENTTSSSLLGRTTRNHGLETKCKARKDMRTRLKRQGSQRLEG